MSQVDLDLSSVVDREWTDAEIEAVKVAFATVNGIDVADVKVIHPHIPDNPDTTTRSLTTLTTRTTRKIRTTRTTLTTLSLATLIIAHVSGGAARRHTLTS